MAARTRQVTELPRLEIRLGRISFRILVDPKDPLPAFAKGIQVLQELLPPPQDRRRKAR